MVILIVAIRSAETISAMIVPNFNAIRRWASNRNIDLPNSKEEICEDDRVREWVNEDVQLVNRNLEKHETIKQFRLVPLEWTPENDLLTSSMKLKRTLPLPKPSSIMMAIRLCLT